MRKGGRPTVRRSVLPLLVLAALAAASLASAAPERSTGTNLTIVGYSIPTAVFPKLTAAYQSTRAGNGVDFSSSFAASEVQSKAVAAGLPADVVNFSIEPDMSRLVRDGLRRAAIWAVEQPPLASRSVQLWALE